MRRLRSSLALIVILFLSLAPLASRAQVYIGIPAPPLLPVYVQPPVPQPNWIWEPGYWAWGPAGYYWVPGTWVAPPAVGLWWTPGYWSWLANGFQWYPGYWASGVGFYGGVNYGFGYYGSGYVGGLWAGNVFRYNTAVTTVNTTIIRNVYIDRTVIVKRVVRVTYNGGPHGIHVRPTPRELAIMHAHHVLMTPEQQGHEAMSARNHNQLHIVNHGVPAHPAVVHPLSGAHPPSDFKPVTAADKAAAPKPAPHPQHPPQPAKPPPH